MNIHRPTMWLGLRLCAAYMWRSALLGLGAIVLFSFAVDPLRQMLDIPAGAGALLLLPCGLLLFGTMSAIVVIHLMERGFGELQLAVLDRQDMNLMKPDIDTGVKVWWAHTWRTALYAGAVIIVVDICLTYATATADLPGPFTRAFMFVVSCGVVIALASKMFYEMMDKGFGPLRLVVLDRLDTSGTTGAGQPENRSHEKQTV